MFKFDIEKGTIDARGPIEDRFEGQSGFSPEDMLEAFDAFDGKDVTILLQ